eukprot:SAG11_NODE_1331_length_5186_cov_3.907608_3_plen_122_part_00
MTVRSASGLRKADRFGKSDAYCIVSVNGDVNNSNPNSFSEVDKTDVAKNTQEPVWEWPFLLSAEGAEHIGFAAQVKFVVYDKDMIGKVRPPPAARAPRRQPARGLPDLSNEGLARDLGEAG